MIISGLVLQINPALAEQIRAKLLTHASLTDLTFLQDLGKMVCVLEVSGPEAAAALLDRLVQIDGIYTVMPAYIHELEEEGQWNSPAVLS